MTHKIITTENYLLVVDDSEIKYKTWYLDDANQVRQCVVLDTDYWKSRKDYKKIIAHLPLNNSPILEGVDLLPPLEDEVEKLARTYTVNTPDNDPVRIYAFIAGYNEAREKYKYTEEDLKNEIIRAFKYGQSNAEMMEAGLERNEVDDYTNNRIQSLQQPKIPVGFKCEDEVYMYSTNGDIMKPKKTTNSQGLTQWVGEYIY